MSADSDMVELRACPFCGSKLSGTAEHGFGHEIGSPDCILAYLRVDRHDIGRWNTRAALDAPGIGELEAALYKLLDYPLFHDSSLTNESSLVLDCRAALSRARATAGNKR